MSTRENIRLIARTPLTLVYTDDQLESYKFFFLKILAVFFHWCMSGIICQWFCDI